MIEVLEKLTAKQIFQQELSKRGKLIKKYLINHYFKKLLGPKDILDGSLSYPSSMGKALRPGILLFSCGAVGGDEKIAIPAAAGVEISHTWTLVHDDIIDNDDIRRGKPSVHHQFYKLAKTRGYSDKEASEYGRNIAILVGDVQHSWTVSLFMDMYKKYKLDPALVLEIINELEVGVIPKLIEGETLDIQYEREKINKLKKEQIIDMSAKKTGQLYSSSAKIGAMIGLKNTDFKHPIILALSNFCFNCGVAFQLQDDILGLISKESKFGKPIGSDIREGKRTTIFWFAYQNANRQEKQQLIKLIGDKKAKENEIKKAINLLIRLKGIEETQRLALQYIHKAKNYLKVVPDSFYKELLVSWANFMVERKI